MHHPGTPTQLMLVDFFLHVCCKQYTYVLLPHMFLKRRQGRLLVCVETRASVRLEKKREGHVEPRRPWYKSSMADFTHEVAFGDSNTMA